MRELHGDAADEPVDTNAGRQAAPESSLVPRPAASTTTRAGRTSVPVAVAFQRQKPSVAALSLCTHEARLRAQGRAGRPGVGRRRARSVEAAGPFDARQPAAVRNCKSRRVSRRCRSAPDRPRARQDERTQRLGVSSKASSSTSKGCTARRQRSPSTRGASNAPRLHEHDVEPRRASRCGWRRPPCLARRSSRRVRWPIGRLPAAQATLRFAGPPPVGRGPGRAAVGTQALAQLVHVEAGRLQGASPARARWHRLSRTRDVHQRAPAWHRAHGRRRRSSRWVVGARWCDGHRRRHTTRCQRALAGGRQALAMLARARARGKPECSASRRLVPGAASSPPSATSPESAMPSPRSLRTTSASAPPADAPATLDCATVAARSRRPRARSWRPARRRRRATFEKHPRTIRLQGMLGVLRLGRAPSWPRPACAIHHAALHGAAVAAATHANIGRSAMAPARMPRRPPPERPPSLRCAACLSSAGPATRRPGRTDRAAAGQEPPAAQSSGHAVGYTNRMPGPDMARQGSEHLPVGGVLQTEVDDPGVWRQQDLRRRHRRW